MLSLTSHLDEHLHALLDVDLGADSSADGKQAHSCRDGVMPGICKLQLCLRSRVSWITFY